MLLRQSRMQEPGRSRSRRQIFLLIFLLTIVNPLTLVSLRASCRNCRSRVRGQGRPDSPGAGCRRGAVNVAIGALGAALGRALPSARGRRAVSAAAARGCVMFGVYGLVAAF